MSPKGSEDRATAEFVAVITFLVLVIAVLSIMAIVGMASELRTIYKKRGAAQTSSGQTLRRSLMGFLLIVLVAGILATITGNIGLGLLVAAWGWLIFVLIALGVERYERQFDVDENKLLEGLSVQEVLLPWRFGPEPSHIGNGHEPVSLPR
jgi:hypothetical protein